jgi:hypothetical protein
MEDFTFRSESIDVEKIMDEIRLRIREKRGVDYTEAQIRELAQAKLERFLDPEPVRSGLQEHYQQERSAGHMFQPPPGNIAIEHETIYATGPGLRGRLISMSRRLLNPVMRMMFNPRPIVDVFHQQREINAYNARHFAKHSELDALKYEVLNNLVVAVTRLAIDSTNQKMRLDALASRLDHAEQRARALEKVVQYRPGATTPAEDATGDDSGSGQGGGGDAARRRRRRGRRTRPSAAPGDIGTIEPGRDTEGSQKPPSSSGVVDDDDETG